MSYLVLSIPKKVLKWMLILQVSETNTFNFNIKFMSTYNINRGFLKAHMVKTPSAIQETPVQFLGWEYLLEKW